MTTVSDLARAKSLLHTGGYTCVLCNERALHISLRRGISPMVELIDAGADLRGFSAADKVVGKAAALLFVLAGVVSVHATVMSEQAVAVFARHGVTCSCDELVSGISNDFDGGSCPMEEAVRDTESPAVAFDAIKQQLRVMRAMHAQPEARSMEGAANHT